MTAWIKKITDSSWSGDPPDGSYGTPVYSPASQSWALDLGEKNYFTERGGWVDGYRPKQVKINFTGGYGVSLYIYRKWWNGYQWTGIVLSGSGTVVKSGEPFELIGLTSDILAIMVWPLTDESITLTSIAFSEDNYVEPEAIPQDTWSDINWAGMSFESEEEARDINNIDMDVANGSPYFMVTSIEEVNPETYTTFGIKYQNSLWQAISENETDEANYMGSHFVEVLTSSYPTIRMTTDERGITNFIYRRSGVYGGIEGRQDFNIDGPPVRGDQTPAQKDYGWAEYSEIESGVTHATFFSITSSPMGGVIIAYTANNKSQIKYFRRYWNDPFTSNYTPVGCLLLEDTNPSNEFRDVAVKVDDNDYIHILYRHDEGSTKYLRAIVNKTGTWSSPETLASFASNFSINNHQVVVDSLNRVHLFFANTAISPRGAIDHYVYSGSSWSKTERIGLSVEYTINSLEAVVDSRDKFHILVNNGSTPVRITNEDGYWRAKSIVSNEAVSTNNSLRYDSYSNKLYCGFHDGSDDVGFITYEPQVSDYSSESSQSSSSDSSSSSADSKSSESSESSSESVSSGSSSSESKDSKSSTGSSSDSSSSSADSKSSSSSSHSSQSWDDPCVSVSGNIAAYSEKTGDTTWPKYDDFGYSDTKGGLFAFNFSGTGAYDYWWLTPQLDGNEWVEVELENTKVPVKITLVGPYNSYNLDYAMTSWDLRGSNTGDFSGEEAVLLRVRGDSFSAGDETHTWNLKNDSSYKYLRIVPLRTQASQTYCRFNICQIHECYDDSSSSLSSESPSISSSSESTSDSSQSQSSQSSESLALVGLYDLCRNTNISSSSSSVSESSYSPDLEWEF